MGLFDDLSAIANEMAPKAVAAIAVHHETPIERMFRTLEEQHEAERALERHRRTVLWSPDGTKNIMFHDEYKLGGLGNEPVGNWQTDLSRYDVDFPTWREFRTERIRLYTDRQSAVQEVARAREELRHDALPIGTVIGFKTKVGFGEESYVGVIESETPQSYVVRYLRGWSESKTARIGKHQCEWRINGQQRKVGDKVIWGSGRSVFVIARNEKQYRTFTEGLPRSIEDIKYENDQAIRRNNIAIQTYRNKKDDAKRAAEAEILRKYQAEIDALVAEAIGPAPAALNMEWVIGRDKAEEYAR